MPFLMSYVDSPQKMQDAFKWWRTFDPGMTKIIPSLNVYRLPNDGTYAHAGRISDLIEVIKDQGSQGVVIFRLEGIPDEVAAILGEGVLAVETPEQTIPDGDFSGDHSVDFRDFILFASHYGTTLGDERFEEKYDLDGDETVGFQDFLRFVNLYRG